MKVKIKSCLGTYIRLAFDNLFKTQTSVTACLMETVVYKNIHYGIFSVLVFLSFNAHS